MSPLELLPAWFLASYGAVVLLAEGAIFNRPRRWLTQRSSLLREMIGCPMCLGFWIGVTLSLAVRLGPVVSVSGPESIPWRIAVAALDGAAVSCAAVFAALARIALVALARRPEVPHAVAAPAPVRRIA